MKFYIHKLGCPKNDVDADYIAARLLSEGHIPVNDPESADSILVNTCGFILPAKEESIEELLRLGQLKKEGNLKTLYATGCLTQRYGDDLLADMPELDGAFGHGALDSIARAVSESQKLTKTVKMETRKLGYLSWKNRFISDDLPYAYLKISDGCDRTCSYCAIPSMRGKFRSRPIDSIVKEARFLADNGKKELILVSQEATVYGYETDHETELIKLLGELDEIEGVDWIRLLYLHPGFLSQRLIDYMASSDNKTLSYFDLPLQHVNSRLLESMKRQVDRPRIEKQLQAIKTADPEAVIRTTFMVGFPGEREEDFAELKEFVRQQRFERMGVFIFSCEPATEAENLPHQVAPEVMAERMDELMLIQQEIAFEENNLLLGNCREVIIDRVEEDGRAVGRTRGDCPEIDQEIFVGGGGLSVGDICQVKIESVEGYDLIGTVMRDER